MIESGMPTHSSNIRLMIGPLIVMALLGPGGCATDVQGPEATAAAQTSAADKQLADNVQAALHADPYLYDKWVRDRQRFGSQSSILLPSGSRIQAKRPVESSLRFKGATPFDCSRMRKASMSSTA